jgi:hydroxyacyl-ACP dehydratase HTD2-like protein with hotdog domain
VTPAPPLVENDVVDVKRVAALHRLLDAPGPPPDVGDRLPPLWHCVAFLPAVRQIDLGPDGRPQPSVTADGDQARVMFAEAALSFVDDIMVGEELTRTARPVRVQEKQGRSGPLVFVTERQEFSARGRVLLVENSTVVHRAGPLAATTVEAAVLPDGAVENEAWPWSVTLEPSPVLLFCFSALTYNPHRIHYDAPYAQQTEGYPALVVQGPLQALAMGELCRRFTSERLTSMTLRAISPAFEGAPLSALGRPSEEPGGVSLKVVQGGRTTMMASGRTSVNQQHH